MEFTEGKEQSIIYFEGCFPPLSLDDLFPKTILSDPFKIGLLI